MSVQYILIVLPSYYNFTMQEDNWNIADDFVTQIHPFLVSFFLCFI